MSYATKDELKADYSSALLIRLTNKDGTEDDFTEIKDAVLESALKDASALIDGYLSARYVVPVSPAPDYFAADAKAIAVSLMIQRKGFSAGTPDESLYNAGMKVIKDRYEMVANGKLSLSIPGTGSGGAAVPPSNVRASAPEKIFSTETLDKF